MIGSEHGSTFYSNMAILVNSKNKAKEIFSKYNTFSPTCFMCTLVHFLLPLHLTGYHMLLFQPLKMSQKYFLPLKFCSTTIYEQICLNCSRHLNCLLCFESLSSLPYHCQMNS